MSESEPLFSEKDTLVSATAKVGCAGIIIGLVVALATPMTILLWVPDAIVVTHLWNWFVIPIVKFPRLGIAQGIGLLVAVRFLVGFNSTAASISQLGKLIKPEPDTSKLTAEEKLALFWKGCKSSAKQMLMRHVLWPMMIIFVAYIFHRFFY